MTDFAFSPHDDGVIASGSQDGTVKVRIRNIFLSQAEKDRIIKKRQKDKDRKDQRKKRKRSTKKDQKGNNQKDKDQQRRGYCIRIPGWNCQGENKKYIFESSGEGQNYKKKDKKTKTEKTITKKEIDKKTKTKKATTKKTKTNNEGVIASRSQDGSVKVAPPSF